MSIVELKNRAKAIFKNNLGKFIQIVLFHTIFLSIIPLHIVIGNSNLDDAVYNVFFIAFFLLPILFFVIPNLNPCIIRSFKGTIYELRNDSTTKSYKYVKNIFKNYHNYLSLTCSKNVFWYILIAATAFFYSFNYNNTSSLLMQYKNNILMQFLIVLIMYSPVIFAFIFKGIYNLQYCFSTYVFHDNPQTSIKNILAQSKTILKGHYNELVHLKFSFAGWYILLSVLVIPLWIINLKPLSIVLFLVGFELINAYQTLAVIEMYNELKLKNTTINNVISQNSQNYQNYINSSAYQNNQNNQNYQNYMNNSNYQNNQNNLNNNL